MASTVSAGEAPAVWGREGIAEIVVAALPPVAAASSSGCASLAAEPVIAAGL